MDRLSFTAAVLLIAYGGAWILAGIVDQPLLWYAPLEHAWHFQVEAPTPVAMDWYGRVLQGVVVGGVFAAAAWYAFPWLPLGKLPWRTLVVGWAAGVMLLCMFLYAYTLARRTVYPPAPQELSVPGKR